MKWLLMLLLSACALPSKTENFCLPKRGMRRLASALSLGFVATFANAEGTEEREVIVRCNNEGLCIVKQADLEWMQRSNNELAKRLAAAEKKAPKCAELEVLPKKKT